MVDSHTSGEPRKRYYVSVQAGQILEDQQAAAYELVIDANENQVAELRSLFKQYASSDDEASLHFPLSPFKSSNDLEMNGNSDHLLKKIYSLIYACGTDETKNHVMRMNIL